MHYSAFVIFKSFSLLDMEYILCYFILLYFDITHVHGYKIYLFMYAVDGYMK